MKNQWNHLVLNVSQNIIFRNSLLLLMFLFFTPYTFSGEVDIIKAKRVAMNCFSEKTDRNPGTIIVDKVFIEKKDEIPLIYIFTFEEGGFIMVAANDVSLPLIGYSDKGDIKTNNYPPALRNHLDYYKEQIYQAIKNKLRSFPLAEEQWMKYDKKLTVFKGEKSKSVSPLLESEWGQGEFYNALCPEAPENSSGHVPAGCVAIAMAQVLNYWSHPWYGEGSNGYTHEDYGYLSADFNTLYNYDLMPNSISNHNSHIAQLIYHCAISVDMNFGPDGSGAWGWVWPDNEEVPNALKDYFYFSNSMACELRSSHPGDWHDLLKTDLDYGRPVIYGGSDLWSDHAHAWVVDGYDGDLYHMNWGWYGNFNGNFTLNDLAPNPNQTHNYNDYHHAVFWAEPKESTLNGTITLAQSPYIINYNHSIQYGEELTIEPGVIMLFWGRYHINVIGKLNAMGTATDTIVFTSNDPVHGWGGLRFIGTTSPDSSRFKFCKFMDGMAFHKGTASGNFRFSNLNKGGAVFLQNASAVSFSNSLFTNNWSFWEGGAISAINASDFILKNTRITQNISELSGGGIYLNNSSLKLYSDTVYLNQAVNGGGLACFNANTSDVWIFSSDISGNQATEKGGGIYCEDTDILFSNNTMSYNNTGIEGGGMYCQNSNIVMSHNEITYNEANEGGGFYFKASSPLVEHSLFNENTAILGGGVVFDNSNGNFNSVSIVGNNADYAGGIFLRSLSNPVLNKLTISENSAVNTGGAINCIDSDPVIKNSIIWNNYGIQEISFDGYSDLTITYSDIKQAEAEIWPGIGNINADPLFENPPWSIFNLTWSSHPSYETKSPCIDSGDPSSTNDPDGTRADMGAIPYEQTYSPISEGDISGILSCAGSPYYIFGNVSVPAGEELIIEPCVYVIFQDDYYLEVKGRLLAEGNSTDKITFYPADRKTGWQGIRFLNTNANEQDSSKMVHCRILDGNADGYNTLSHGGGVFASQSSKLVIDSCYFSGNRSLLTGGGICLISASSPDIRNSIFVNNGARMGGGIGCYDNINTNFLNCSFSNNTAEYGGAISASSCGPSFSGLTITNNRALRFGGGIYRDGGQSISFDESNRCNIYNNYADFAGLDFYSAQDVYIPPFTTIYLDTATVDEYNEHLAFPIHLFEVYSNQAKFVQEASDLYVSPAGSDMFSGTSSSDPLKTIKTALIKIIADSLNPKTIYLADGIYNKKGTGEYFPINHKSYVTLSGESRNNTIIDGESLYQLMTSYTDTNDLVKNITFQNAYKDGDGGAVVIEYYSKPTFQNVTFKNNYCEHDGGAVWCFDNCSPVFSYVSFMNNTSNNAAGAMMCNSNELVTMDSVLFQSNESRYSGGGLQVDYTDVCNLYRCSFASNSLLNGSGGGAVFRVVLVNADSLSFTSNNVIGDAGALWSYGATLNIKNSIFHYNSATVTGGAIGFYNGVHMDLDNVVFRSNTAVHGGGIWGYSGSTLDIRNGLFVYNNTLNDPDLNGTGGALCIKDVETTLTNVTLSGNAVDEEGYGGGLYCWASNTNTNCSIQNSIFWENTPDQIYSDYNATVSVNYSDIEDGWTSGNGNLNIHPGFIGGSIHAFSLYDLSPCINVGNPDTSGLVLPIFDLAGNPRISNERIDMGAYEFFDGIELDLKAFLEGPYNGSSMNTYLTGHPELVEGLPNQQPYNSPPWNYPGKERVFFTHPANAVDWVLLQVRDTMDVSLTTQESIRGQQAIFLLSDGTMVDINGSNPKFGNSINHQCYISILHRNHLGIISATPLSESGGVYSYDFTIAIGQAYNSGQKELGSGVYGMIGGDSDSDGEITELDKTLWELMAGEAGYLSEDFKLNGQVDNQDKNEILINNMGSYSQIPE